MKGRARWASSVRPAAEAPTVRGSQWGSGRRQRRGSEGLVPTLSTTLGALSAVARGRRGSDSICLPAACCSCTVPRCKGAALRVTWDYSPTWTVQAQRHALCALCALCAVLSTGLSPAPFTRGPDGRPSVSLECSILNLEPALPVSKGNLTMFPVFH